mgnify:CR=1 FL=1
MISYYNVLGATSVTWELVKPTSQGGGGVYITNVHQTDNATISLFLQNAPASDSPSTYYVVKNVVMPPGSSLNIATFRKSGWGIYVTVGETDTLDIIVS